MLSDALYIWRNYNAYKGKRSKEFLSSSSMNSDIRYLVLSKRCPTTTSIATRLGTAVHTQIELMIQDPEGRKLLKKGRGYSDNVINNMVVNPEVVLPHQFPIYQEQRRTSSVNGINISGQFDLVWNGVLEDFKTVGTYSYVNFDPNKYKMQGSVYKWLFPDLIKADYMLLSMIFKDWRTDQSVKIEYPSEPEYSFKVPLYSVEETQRFLEQKTKEYLEYMDKNENELPICSDEQRWKKNHSS